LVHLDHNAVTCIEDAFASLASGDVVMPPILSMAIAEYNGEVDVKTAYVPGIESFAIKMSPGFFDNPKIGLPSTSGLMILFSAKTGVLQALLLDNGYLTDVRTAAAGAVAAKHLSREDCETACIVGTGMQARLQLQALTLVRPIRRAVIWGRDAKKAEKFAFEAAQSLGIEVTADQDIENAVRNADIIVTTTPSTKPLIKGEWLNKGQHVTAMGSDQEHKNELCPTCILKADLYVADRLSQTELLGELHHVKRANQLDKIKRCEELGTIIAGTAVGRETVDQITIADLTGTGIQDTAIATLTYRLAGEQSAGVQFDN